MEAGEEAGSTDGATGGEAHGDVGYAMGGATDGATDGVPSELAKEGTRVVVDGDSGVVFCVTPKLVAVIYDEKTWEGIPHDMCKPAWNLTISPLQCCVCLCHALHHTPMTPVPIPEHQLHQPRMQTQRRWRSRRKGWQGR